VAAPGAPGTAVSTGIEHARRGQGYCSPGFLSPATNNPPTLTGARRERRPLNARGARAIREAGGRGGGIPSRKVRVFPRRTGPKDTASMVWWWRVGAGRPAGSDRLWTCQGMHYGRDLRGAVDTSPPAYSAGPARQITRQTALPPLVAAGSALAQAEAGWIAPARPTRVHGAGHARRDRRADHKSKTGGRRPPSAAVHRLPASLGAGAHAGTRACARSTGGRPRAQPRRSR